MNELTTEDTGFVFPQIPEDTKRETFKYTEWEGFAVTEAELQVIEKLLANPTVQAQYAELYEKGKKLRDAEGNVVISELNPSQVIGVRYDGPAFLINCLAQHQCPPDPKEAEKGFRKKMPDKGVLFTALADAEITALGQINKTTEIAPDELEKRVTKTTGFYSDSAVLEAANPLLLEEAKSNELNLTLVSHALRKGEDLSSYAEWFGFEGQELWDYLERVRKERGSVLWGVNRDIVRKEDFRFGHGDFAGLNEIDVQNEEGVIPSSNFSFFATKSGTLEDKLGQVCQEKTSQ